MKHFNNPSKFQLEKPSGVFMPIIRYALIAIGGSLVSQGYVSADQLDALVGGLMIAGTTGWMFYNKKVKGH